jgi:hypothetical protein
MKAFALGAALLLAAPVAAQQAPAAAAPVAVDPVRLAAARPVVARLWPLGTYKRLMAATVDKMMNGMLQQMMGMRPGDLGLPADGKVPPDKTMGEMAATADPHFTERMQLTTRVMFDEFARLMTPMEPAVQDALAHALARRFRVAELGELERFFATPTGTRFAAEAMLLGTDPEMLGAMMKFAPTIIKEMPGIMARAEAATKHLPPQPAAPPANAKDEDTDS